MITAFCFGLGAAFLTGLAGNYAWRRLPAALAPSRPCSASLSSRRRSASAHTCT